MESGHFTHVSFSFHSKIGLIAQISVDNEIQTPLLMVP